jgi:hypothetical protein
MSVEVWLSGQPGVAELWAPAELEERSWWARTLQEPPISFLPKAEPLRGAPEESQPEARTLPVLAAWHESRSVHLQAWRCEINRSSSEFHPHPDGWNAPPSQKLLACRFRP